MSSQRNTLYGSTIALDGGNIGYVELRTQESEILRLTGVVNVVDSSPGSLDAALQINGVPLVPAAGSAVKEYQIIVNQANVATTLGGTIDSTKVYFIDGPVDTGTIEILCPAGGIQISGHGVAISSLTTSENNQTLFTCSGAGCGSLLLSNINLSVTGTGSKVFDLCDIDGTHAVEFDIVNFTDCTSLGFLEHFRQGLETGTSRFGGTPTLEFEGIWSGGYFIQVSIARNLTNSVYSLLKCAVGQTFGSRLGGNMNYTLPSNVTLFECTSANFTRDDLLQVTGAEFEGTGPVFSGVDETNDSVRVSTTRGIPNTHVGGYWELTSEVETPIAVQGTFYKILGTTTYTDLAWFNGSAGSNAMLQTADLETQIGISFVGSFASGNNKNFTIKVRCWNNSAGVYVDVSSTDFTSNGIGRFESVTLITKRLSMEVDDRVEVWIANISDTTNVTCGLNSNLHVREFN